MRGMEKEQRRMSDTARVAMNMFLVVSITLIDQTHKYKSQTINSTITAELHVNHRVNMFLVVSIKIK